MDLGVIFMVAEGDALIVGVGVGVTPLRFPISNIRIAETRFSIFGSGVSNT